MLQGVIKKLVADRGFGFIGREGADVFFHHSSVEDGRFDDLQIGQAVEFDVEDGDPAGRGKGPRASMVRLA